jgi:hypothetical protein
MISKKLKVKSKKRALARWWLFNFYFSIFTFPEHPPPDLLLVCPKEGKLPEKEGNDQNDHLVTEYQHYQPEEKFPEPECLAGKSHPPGDIP